MHGRVWWITHSLSCSELLISYCITVQLVLWPKRPLWHCAITRSLTILKCKVMQLKQQNKLSHLLCDHTCWHLWCFVWCNAHNWMVLANTHKDSNILPSTDSSIVMYGTVATQFVFTSSYMYGYLVAYYCWGFYCYKLKKTLSLIRCHQ